MALDSWIPKHANTIFYAILLLLIYILTLHQLNVSSESEHIPTVSPDAIFIEKLNKRETPRAIDNYKELLALALKAENRNITLIINSCARLDLLNRTLSSLMKYWPHDKYPIYEKMLVDDCRNKTAAIELVNRYYPQYEIVLTANNAFEEKYINREERITLAMEKLMRQVRSHWVYHIEDDWLFTRHGFIDDSFDIFETNLDEKDQTGAAWINHECHRYEEENKQEKNRACTAPKIGLQNKFHAQFYRHNCCQKKPEEWRREPIPYFYFNASDKYSIVLCWKGRQNWRDTRWLYEYKGAKWFNMKYLRKKRGKEIVYYGGYSFNSGLMPTVIYKKYMSELFSPQGEWGVSLELIENGFKVAMLANTACDHIGRKRHVET